MLLSMNTNLELIAGVLSFISMIVLCVVLIISRIKNNKPKEIGAPITIIIIMIIAIVMYIRDPQSLTRESNDEPILEVTQETESKTNAEENLKSRAEQGLIRYEDLTKYVVADKDTHILYVKYSSGYAGYFSPYYSENGKLCKYEDGKIIEVVE